MSVPLRRVIRIALYPNYAYVEFGRTAEDDRNCEYITKPMEYNAGTDVLLTRAKKGIRLAS